MNWFFKLFNKVPEVKKPSSTILSFSVEQSKDPETSEDTHFVGVSLKDAPLFLEFIRNSDYKIDTSVSDAELAHLFIYSYSQRWLSENAKNPIFIETHSFPEHSEIKYDRTWNSAFIGAVTKLGFEQLPQSEDEMIEMYMNYIYGTRMMDEMAAMEAANPQSIAHPSLSNPDNNFKG